MVFHPAANIDPVALVWLVQSEPKRYRFEGGERLGITAPLPEGEHRIQALHAVFDRIAAKDAVNAAADRGTCARSSPRCRQSGSVRLARCAAQVNLTAIMSVKANMNKKLAVACLVTVVLWGGPGVRSAWAGGHGGSTGHGGFHGRHDFHGHGGFHRHGGFHGDDGFRGRFGFFIGAPLFWPPPYYAYPYDYPPTVVYDYPPAVVVERQPQAYIQREPYYWYYCPEPSGYYPYVQNCPRGWQQVVPSAPLQ